MRTIRSSRARAPGLALALAALGSGCTALHIHPQGDASVQTRWLPGLAQVKIDTGTNGAVIYRSTGLGASRSATGTTIGLWNETTAVFAQASDCRTVIWVESAAQVAELQRLLSANGRSLATLCFVQQQGEPR